MERVRDRDIAAFELIYDGYHRLVFGIALKMLGEQSEAEDLTQHVFLKIWRTPESFRTGYFGAWLARVTRNSALDIIRSRKARDSGTLAVDLAIDASVDDQIISRINGERIRAALALLPEDQRTSIELGFYGGITHEEIARRTATPLGTVKTRIRSGLRKLREHLHDAVTL